MSEGPPSPDLPRREVEPDRFRHGVVAAIAVAAIAASMIWPWVLSGRDSFAQKAYDHDRYHLPLVRQFAAEWPSVDLSDYDSATGPGFHLLIATGAQAVGDGETALQILGSLCGIGLLATVAGRLAVWRRSALEGALLTLPLAASPYVIGNSIWLMTDNLSLLLLAVPLLGASLSVPTTGRLWRWGVAAAAACLVRQINLWVLAPIAIAGWFASWRCDSDPPVEDGATMHRRFSPWPIAFAFAAGLPAIAVVAGLAWLWGGLTPPSFQEYHAVSMQPAAVPYGLTLAAVYGAPLAIAVGWRGGRRGAMPGWFAPAVSLGWAVFLTAGDSFAGLEVGRNGGWLWTLVERSPEVAGVSSVLALGSVLGVVLLVQLVATAYARDEARGRGAVVAVVALAACLVAHAANKQLFQRYFDPPVLLVLATLTALAWPRTGAALGKDPRTDRAWIAALLAMAAIQVVFATATLFVPLAGR